MGIYKSNEKLSFTGLTTCTRAVYEIAFEHNFYAVTLNVFQLFFHLNKEEIFSGRVFKVHESFRRY
jgi:hypothetical protein